MNTRFKPTLVAGAVMLEGERGEVLRDPRLELDAPLAAAVMKELQRRLGGFADVGAFADRGGAARARVAQQVVEHALEPLYLLADESAESVVEFGIVEPLGQQLEEGLDGDERIADLVDDLRDEPAEGGEAIEAGDRIVHLPQAIEGELGRHRLRELMRDLGEHRERARPQWAPDAFGKDEQHGGRAIAEARDRGGRDDALGAERLELEVVGGVGEQLDLARVDEGVEEGPRRLDAHRRLGRQRRDDLRPPVAIVDPGDGPRHTLLAQQTP